MSLKLLPSTRILDTSKLFTIVVITRGKSNLGFRLPFRFPELVD